MNQAVMDYAVFSKEEKVNPGALYDSLAKTYESDIPKLGYYNHEKCHVMVEKHRPRSVERDQIKIMDMACGTGFVAELL